MTDESPADESVNVAGNCTNYQQEFERVFSVPGEMAMLNSTLVTPTVFDYTAEPYNITWYDVKTGREVSSEAGRILVRGETLWFLNVTLDDSGDYLTVVRCRSGEERFARVVLSPLRNVFLCFFAFFFYQNVHLVLQADHRAGGGATGPGRVQEAQNGSSDAH